MPQTTITFDSITKDQQRKLQDVYTIVDILNSFSNKANNSLFTYLFGDKEGAYQIDAFKSTNNIIHWFMHLTSDQKGIVLANIYYNDVLYSHCC